MHFSQTDSKSLPACTNSLTLKDSVVMMIKPEQEFNCSLASLIEPLIKVFPVTDFLNIKALKKKCLTPLIPNILGVNPSFLFRSSLYEKDIHFDNSLSLLVSSICKLYALIEFSIIFSPCNVSFGK